LSSIFAICTHSLGPTLLLSLLNTTCSSSSTSQGVQSPRSQTLVASPSVLSCLSQTRVLADPALSFLCQQAQSIFRLPGILLSIW
jgi:hypothetical protein